MKRLFCLLLVLALLLAGCGNKTAEAPTEPSTEAPTTEATEPPTTEATEPETEPTTEATEPEPTEPPIPRNPLTGEVLEEPYTSRPVAFSLNNISVCLPQHGLQYLDWMFEVETEGGITRCVGVMTDPAKAGAVGPIRSCRSYFLSLSVGYDAPLFHCGGSIYVDSNQYSISESVASWDHVDEKAASSYFYRDNNRYKNLGYAWEHTLFTSGERMVQAMESRGYYNTDAQELSYGYSFSEDVTLEGTSATTVKIPFRGDKVTTMEYDAESGLYLAHQYGKDWVDGDTGKNVAFRNILVINAAQSNKQTSYGNHSFYDMIGTGSGYYAVNGQMVNILWQRDSVNDSYHFTYEDGTPITLGVGKTYCAITDTSCTPSAT